MCGTAGLASIALWRQNHSILEMEMFIAFHVQKDQGGRGNPHGTNQWQSQFSKPDILTPFRPPWGDHEALKNSPQQWLLKSNPSSLSSIWKDMPLSGLGCALLVIQHQAAAKENLYSCWSSKSFLPKPTMNQARVPIHLLYCSYPKKCL